MITLWHHVYYLWVPKGVYTGNDNLRSDLPARGGNLQLQSHANNLLNLIRPRKILFWSAGLPLHYVFITVQCSHLWMCSCTWFVCLFIFHLLYLHYHFAFLFSHLVPSPEVFLDPIFKPYKGQYVYFFLCSPACGKPLGLLLYVCCSTDWIPVLRTANGTWIHEELNNFHCVTLWHCMQRADLALAYKYISLLKSSLTVFLPLLSLFCYLLPKTHLHNIDFRKFYMLLLIFTSLLTLPSATQEIYSLNKVMADVNIYWKSWKGFLSQDSYSSLFIYPFSDYSVHSMCQPEGMKCTNK